ncbi:hypothetical protein [Brucella pituitosa]|uniref:DUF4382 domain-containing protein n=1 Tax=Brucella pituitosa TaxID=571256 RepID=A0ABS3K1F5_9HYPH|nr:hypothetical protein [Brucella pituitosa]MBO1039888.1 hypothetical protein [Brucella pituitosa]
MSKSPSYHLLSILVGSLILTGCNTSSDPTALNKSAIDNARKTEGYVAAKGAAIVARVTINGKICHQANIQLQALENGQLVPRNITSIGQNYSLADIGKITLRMATLNIPGVFDVIDSQDIRVSFQPIAPGEYGIARIVCSWDANHRSVLEADSGGFFGLGKQKTQVPLQLDGKISVKKGEIVDAGVLNIISNSTGRALILASPAPQSYRDTIKRNLPELYPKITFRQFSR